MNRKCMSLFLVLGWIFVLSNDLIAAEESYRYYSYKKNGKDIKNEIFVQIEEMENGGKKISRQIQEDDCLLKDEMILDEEYNVNRWTRICEEKETEFTGERAEDVFLITGKLNGKAVNKSIELKNKPFYILPRFSLSFLALSEMKELKFSILRRDQLERMPMQAEHRGEEKIEVNGKMIDAYKVYYSATGLREKYYNRLYYYRKSDGLYVKKVEPDGAIEELVDVE